MKKSLAFIIIFIACSIVNAQVPQLLGYQGIARDNAGTPKANSVISLRLSILDGSASGTTVYMETFTGIQTNQFGLFTVQIGGGAPVTGSFVNINWSLNSKWLRSEIDLAGGVNFIAAGTAIQFVTVPFALVANKALSSPPMRLNDLTNVAVSGAAASQYLKYDGTNWVNATIPGSSQWINSGNDIYNSNTGNVGIGLSTPTQKLQVAGNINISLDSNIRINDKRILSAKGSQNIFLGEDAGFKNATGTNNNFIGYQAGYNNSFSSNGIFIGTQAGFNNASTQSSNIFIGVGAGYDNSGFDNIFIGATAGFKNTTGITNHFFGHSAGYSNTTGSNNTFVGDQAGYSNTTANNNTFTGYTSGHSNTIGFNNTFYGHYSGSGNTIGSYNTATGEGTLFSNTSGNQNTATGNQSLYFNTASNSNTANGYRAAYNTNAIGNTAIGWQALFGNTSGTYNTAIGMQSLDNLSTGNNNTAVGYLSGVSTGTISNATAIGYLATANADNKVVIGNALVSVIGGFSNWSNLSDGRFKENIKEEVPGLTFINKLRPITYTLNSKKLETHITQQMPDSIKSARVQPDSYYQAASKTVHTGFIAQEVEASARQIGYQFDGVNAPTNQSDYYSLSYSQLTVPLVKAVQELSVENDQLQKKLKQIEEEYKSLKAELLEVKKFLTIK
jgi:hypothetical protein